VALVYDFVMNSELEFCYPPSLVSFETLISTDVTL
jgi:hypothetical protein